MPFSPSATVGAIAFALGLAAVPAGAGNWTLLGTASQRLEANSNLRLDEDGEALFGSTTGVDLELGYDARRTLWALGSGVRFREFVGPGDAEGLEGFSDPRASGSVEHRGKRQVLGADFDVRRQPVTFSELEEFEDIETVEEVENDATETRIGFGADWSWLATPRTSFLLGADIDARRFSDEGEVLTPSTSVAFSGGWSRALDPRTDAGLNLGYRHFTSDGELTDVETDVVSLGASATRRLTPRHTIGLGAGLGHTWTELTRPDPFPTESVTGLSFSGDLNFAWLGPQDTQVVLTAARELEPNLEGTLANTTRIGAVLSRPLTRRTDVSLNAAYVRRLAEESLGGEDERSQLFRVGARLSRDLTRLWDASIGADLRYRDDDEDSARSLGAFFEIRRDLVLNR